MTLSLLSVRDVAERVREFTLAAPDGAKLPGFAAGAHVEVRLPDGETRPYSLVDLDATAAGPDRYVLGVLLERDSRGGSRHMHALQPGDTLTLSAPKNSFALAEGAAPALLIAGGIGITPIVSMATALKAEGRPYRMVYAGRHAGAMAFADVLRDHHGAALTLHHDDVAGGPLPLAPIIQSAAPETHIYVCGPRAMIEAAREAATAAGFTPEQVHFELFEQAALQTGDQPFEVEIASTGQVFTVPADKTIIEALEDEGIDLIYDCQRGDCGICQTGLLEGEADHRDVVLTDAERAANTLIHICVSRARSARLKLDL
ncbi:MAG: oxidoreductase [Pararhodobacter sp.]|nr:oxidoreductase [Pararhodobacter sp.]